MLLLINFHNTICLSTAFLNSVFGRLFFCSVCSIVGSLGRRELFAFSVFCACEVIMVMEKGDSLKGIG